MPIWGWAILAICSAIAFGIGWLVGDDHGRATTNREWLDPKNKDWKRLTVIKGGGVATEIITGAD